MKKRLTLLFLMVVLLMAACTNDDTATNDEKNNTTDEETTEQAPNEQDQQEENEQADDSQDKESSDETEEQDSHSDNAKEDLGSDESEEGAEEETVSNDNVPYPSDAQETGNASVIISTPTGSSHGGNIPSIEVAKDSMLVQITVDLLDFDSNNKVHLYVNDQFITSEKVDGNKTITIPLQGNNLAPGTYTVTAVQYKGNNTQSNEIINLSKGKYQLTEATS
ncbi:hypothetical protein [Pontibacillus litoralis]|uniref:Uncharacterized protein n=1 Tax=Pontibacillus litoralis JSM 072002 TaxID=1385512 RepID=A0A0A5G467_9BACI|nr:hypothetical protein [Pontibacillus litoralis]KGX85880.1 hypothetical protein N784_06565 [Pontibacillus litoralis JSM 072002]